jgi:hypothetical protein
MSSKDGRKDPLKDASDLLVEQEKRFKSAVQHMNTVFEIDLSLWGGIAGTGGSGVPARIDLQVGPISEEPIQGDQNEVGKDFLFDTAFGLGVKVLNDEDALADLVKLLDAPSAMVDVNELMEGIAVGSEQGGAQAKDAVADFVFKQS